MRNVRECEKSQSLSYDFRDYPMAFIMGFSSVRRLRPDHHIVAWNKIIMQSCSMEIFYIKDLRVL